MNVLLAVIGTSPAVLTGTVWALATAPKPFLPDHVVVRLCRPSTRDSSPPAFPAPSGSEGVEALPLDLLSVTPALREAWAGRERIGDMTVVSREGRAAMKALRGSGTDRDDIAKLEDHADED